MSMHTFIQSNKLVELSHSLMVLPQRVLSVCCTGLYCIYVCTCQSVSAGRYTNYTRVKLKAAQVLLVGGAGCVDRQQHSVSIHTAHRPTDRPTYFQRIATMLIVDTNVQQET